MLEAVPERVTLHVGTREGAFSEVLKRGEGAREGSATTCQNKRRCFREVKAAQQHARTDDGTHEGAVGGDGAREEYCTTIIVFF